MPFGLSGSDSVLGRRYSKGFLKMISFPRFFEGLSGFFETGEKTGFLCEKEDFIQGCRVSYVPTAGVSKWVFFKSLGLESRGFFGFRSRGWLRVLRTGNSDFSMIFPSESLSLKKGMNDCFDEYFDTK